MEEARGLNGFHFTGAPSRLCVCSENPSGERAARRRKPPIPRAGRARTDLGRRGTEPVVVQTTPPVILAIFILSGAAKRHARLH
jgi:hypothetical protein